MALSLCSVQHPQLPPTHYNLESGNYFRDAGTEYQWSDSNLSITTIFFLNHLRSSFPPVTDPKSVVNFRLPGGSKRRGPRWLSKLIIFPITQACSPELSHDFILMLLFVLGKAPA